MPDLRPKPGAVRHIHAVDHGPTIFTFCGTPPFLAVSFSESRRTLDKLYIVVLWDVKRPLCSSSFVSLDLEEEVKICFHAVVFV